MTTTYLPSGLPAPLPAADGLDAPFWEGTRRHQLLVQQCRSCGHHRFGPEWICHHCRSLETTWTAIEPAGRIFGYERVWHPVHPVLASAVPYLIVLVELPHADDIRMLGNLLGDPHQACEIGDPVRAQFEDHDGYTLVQWRIVP
jgi:uncharacterized OB-fold protein